MNTINPGTIMGFPLLSENLPLIIHMPVIIQCFMGMELGLLL